jgi:hypothetical protein
MLRKYRQPGVQMFPRLQERRLDLISPRRAQLFLIHFHVVPEPPAPHHDSGLAADDLQGHEAFHATLPRLEDLARAAFAEQIKQTVLVQDEFLPLPASEQVGLERSQPAAANQFLAEGLDVRELLLPGGELGPVVGR